MLLYDRKASTPPFRPCSDHRNTGCIVADADATAVSRGHSSRLATIRSRSVSSILSPLVVNLNVTEVTDEHRRVPFKQSDAEAVPLVSRHHDRPMRKYFKTYSPLREAKACPQTTQWTDLKSQGLSWLKEDPSHPNRAHYRTISAPAVLRSSANNLRFTANGGTRGLLGRLPCLLCSANILTL